MPDGKDVSAPPQRFQCHLRQRDGRERPIGGPFAIGRCAEHAGRNDPLRWAASSLVAALSRWPALAEGVIRRQGQPAAIHREVVVPAGLQAPLVGPELQAKLDSEDPVIRGEALLTKDRLDRDRRRRCQDLLLAYLRGRNGRAVLEDELRDVCLGHPAWEVGEALVLLRRYGLVVRVGTLASPLWAAMAPDGRKRLRGRLAVA